MAEFDGGVAGFFARHQATLEFGYTVLHKHRKPESATAYYQGFLLSLDQCVLWATAGHCIEQIKKALSNPLGYGDFRFRFWDSLHDAAKTRVPFVIASEDIFDSICLHPRYSDGFCRDGILAFYS
jgi:hypothetical protein